MSEKIKKLLDGQGGNYIFPFFWQHGEDEAVLREYMKVIDECSIKAVCVESRPHPDYCGPKWWQDMDVILDEAKKRGMKVWILDDSHFPTGYANGVMTEKPGELRRQSICCRMYPCGGGEKLSLGEDILKQAAAFVPTKMETIIAKANGRDPAPKNEFDDDRLLCVCAVRMGQGKDGFADAEDCLDLMPCIRDGKLDWEVPEGDWKVYVLHVTKNRGYHRDYINMLDRESCRVLIDAVYEPHWEHYREEFGTVIAGFFSDEPELGNGHLYEQQNMLGTSPDADYPWSRELEDALKDSLGNAFPQYLALLWENDADRDVTAKVRYSYMDLVSRLVEKDFSFQIGDWCREHGVEYIGHLIEDNNQHARTGSSLRHFFRGLAGQDMAGIDDIGGQVLPQGEGDIDDGNPFQKRDGEFYHYMLGKLCSSAAAIEPLKKGNSMCEIFGAYGWAEGVRLEKYLAVISWCGGSTILCRMHSVRRNFRIRTARRIFMHMGTIRSTVISEG